MTEKYRILRIMATVYKILAWVSLVAGVAASIFVLVAGSVLSQQLGTAGAAGGGFVAFIIMLVYTAFIFGSFYALAQGIHLLFDIERETHMTETHLTETRKAA